MSLRSSICQSPYCYPCRVICTPNRVLNTRFGSSSLMLCECNHFLFCSRAECISGVKVLRASHLCRKGCYQNFIISIVYLNNAVKICTCNSSEAVGRRSASTSRPRFKKSRNSLDIASGFCNLGVPFVAMRYKAWMSVNQLTNS